MKQPSLDILLNHVDSKYTLVVAAAKRARLLTEGARQLVESDSYKPVTVALEEIAQDKVKYHRITKTGLK